MSERTFFALRYALPGYTFILMTILVAFPKLLEFFQSEIPNVQLIAALLAFLYLLSGGAIGFLISQVWYVVFNSFINGRYGKFPETRKFLRKNYNLAADLKHQNVFLDYVHRLSSKQTQIYTQRRYDLMHVCSSTFVTTLFGLFSGFLVRVDFVRNTTFERPHWTTLEETIKSLTSISTSALCITLFLVIVLFFAFLLIIKRRHYIRTYILGVILFVSFLIIFLVPHITTYDAGVILIAALLLIFLFLGSWHVGREHAIGADISVMEVVNSGRLSGWEARMAFTPDYFD